jgi:isopentenyl-diphosphate Delta-isomerase
VPPGTDPVPNPAEVMDWKWGAWDDVVNAVGATPFVFSPWSVLQVERLARA